MNTTGSTRTRTRWPLPDQVATWGDLEAFRASRVESGQWVFWEDRADLVLQARYDDVKPLHIELSPTYLCNFACPWCSCRSAREDWSDDDVFNHPRATPMTVMRKDKLDHVLTHLAEDQVGIMWVGGEPTMNPLMYPAALRGTELGLQQCLFTNGSLLQPKRIATLFDARLAFIRVSLNAVTPDVHQAHHDYDPRRGYAKRVMDNLRALAETGARRQGSTKVGVSVVVDERNLDDLEATAEHLCRLAEKYGHGAVSYAIFRPAFPLNTAQIDMRPDTVDRFLNAVGPDSPWNRRMREAGIDVVVPEQSLSTQNETPADLPVRDDMGCLSAGWFGEITPNADMVLCSDQYGNPDYFIGNVATTPLTALWAGEGRRTALEHARQTSCYTTSCPRNGRGYFFNRIFRQVENLRRQGRIHEVAAWMEDLRAVLPRPTHSFFL
ncbi:sulfatase maturation enzyme AslB (radical SAM superfamily) [Streptomyces sp. LBL]|uniref:radical SAM protein n=1 Tax=Streptomyces sp. LBL TaxID=2940562 RepID=UPI002476EF2E|nr:radical SAM protein [Streptomyces sp. LBL]MDH6624410.1 sulfatase maturation enzyme AslB (radical SAM superfamily) [Streptomyces sp. LBL]